MICAGCGKIIKKFEEYCSECAVLLSQSQVSKEQFIREHHEEGGEKENVQPLEKAEPPMQIEVGKQTAIEKVEEVKPPTYIKNMDNYTVEQKREAHSLPTIVYPENRAIQEVQQPHTAPITTEKTDKNIVKIETKEQEILLKEAPESQIPYSPPEQITTIEVKKADVNKDLQDEIQRLREELEILRSGQTKKETQPSRGTTVDEPTETSSQLDSLIERRSPQRFDSLDVVDKEKEEQQFGRREHIGAPSTHTQMTESKIPTTQPRETQPQTEYPQTRPPYQLKTTKPSTQPKTGLEFRKPYGPQIETKPPAELGRPQIMTKPLRTIETKPVGQYRPQIMTKPPNIIETKPTGREKLQLIEETLYACPHCNGEFRIDASEIEKDKTGAGGESTEGEDVEKIVICPHCKKEIVLGQTEKSLF